MVAATTSPTTQRGHVYNPNDVAMLAYRIAEKCALVDYRPDAVVGLAPWVMPAQLVAKELGVTHVASIQVAREREDGPIITMSTPVWLGDSRPQDVLLVTHARDEGRYLSAAHCHLKMGQCLNVRTAALVAVGARGLLGGWEFPNVDFFGELRHELPQFFWDMPDNRNQRW